MLVVVFLVVVVISSPIAHNQFIYVIARDEAIPHGPEGARPDRRLVFYDDVKFLNVEGYGVTQTL